ncbi:hypothetical protein BC937DRAFT_92425 [Endogone sp. FLAS-F59071]|nr:hypothetical protein BC937DRAFT_92425 [Endogone sp. FLAS-F59071]|eukprot:RUS15448.1 hypothetical protein BC937DRAFT_92425 [Endogone sp. FLAS-F59071]
MSTTSESSLNPIIPPEPLRPVNFNSRTIAKKIFFFIAITLIIDAIAPVVLYSILKNNLQLVWAILISGTPPVLSVILNAIKAHRVDAIGIIVTSSFLITLIASFISGNPRLLLLRESFNAGIVGVIFLFTLIPIRGLRPIMYYLTRQLVAGDTVTTEYHTWLWTVSSRFRKLLYVITVLWGVGEVAEMGVRLVFVFTLPIDDVVYVSNLALAAITVTMVLTTVGLGFWMKQGITAEVRKVREQREMEELVVC